MKMLSDTTMTYHIVLVGNKTWVSEEDLWP